MDAIQFVAVLGCGALVCSAYTILCCVMLRVMKNNDGSHVLYRTLTKSIWYDTYLDRCRTIAWMDALQVVAVLVCGAYTIMLCDV